ncbi:MAG: PAS domain-containing sensor histidine kinase [Alphaproteobacteria bacterium]
MENIRQAGFVNKDKPNYLKDVLGGALDKNGTYLWMILPALILVLCIALCPLFINGDYSYFNQSFKVNLTLSQTITIASLTSIILLLLNHIQSLRTNNNNIRKQSSRYKSYIDLAMERSGSGLWIWDISQGKIFFPRAILNLLGLRKKEGYIPFTQLIEMMDENGINFYKIANKIIKNEESSIDIEFQLKHNNGQFIWFHLKAKLAKNKNSSYKQLVGIITDINDQKNSKDKTLNSNMRIRDAIESIPESFVLWDYNNKLVMCNSKYKQFYCLAPNLALPGTDRSDVEKFSIKPVIKTKINEDDNHQNSINYEVKLKDSRWLNISEKKTNDGGSVSIGKDITNLKKNESKLIKSENDLIDTIHKLESSKRKQEHLTKQLIELAEKNQDLKERAEESNKLKSDFMLNISHELRTPLNAIIGFSELMKSNRVNNINKYKEYAFDIHQSGQDLLHTIESILEISNLENNEVSIEKSNQKIKPIIDGVLGLFRDDIKNKNITIYNNFNSDADIYCNKIAMKQIISNIISNAIKFNKNSGNIKIESEDNHNSLDIIIKDTGNGIPQSSINYLYEPFGNINNPITKNKEGIGLGLPISKSLIDIHNGAIDIKSKRGEGTTVTISLPLIKQRYNLKATG